MTETQKGKLIHAFGLDYKNTPWRNYYYCGSLNEEWENLIENGYASKSEGNAGVFYHGTLKGLLSSLSETKDSSEKADIKYDLSTERDNLKSLKREREEVKRDLNEWEKELRELEDELRDIKRAM